MADSLVWISKLDVFLRWASMKKINLIFIVLLGWSVIPTQSMYAAQSPSESVLVSDTDSDDESCEHGIVKSGDAGTRLLILGLVGVSELMVHEFGHALAIMAFDR